MTEKIARRVFVIVAGGFVILNLVLMTVVFHGGSASHNSKPQPTNAVSTPTNPPGTNAEAGR